MEQGKASELVDLLRRLVKLKGWRVHELAKSCDLDRNFFSRTRQRGSIHMDKFFKLCGELDTSPHVLIAMVDPETLQALSIIKREKILGLKERLLEIRLRGDS